MWGEVKLIWGKEQIILSEESQEKLRPAAVSVLRSKDRLLNYENILNLLANDLVTINPAGETTVFIIARKRECAGGGGEEII